ncbi:hypothetical protein JZ751_001656 [Albula glossodonta]|uniref:Uncharacterized protein n=1 Tax=Albula glossodonta TaxID=121402 RepID=A0A8T2PUC8_9TELE|nr:hypothetical protein JZ751_001656 [Albula glossodonta]
MDGLQDLKLSGRTLAELPNKEEELDLTIRAWRGPPNGPLEEGAEDRDGKGPERDGREKGGDWEEGKCQ